MWWGPTEASTVLVFAAGDDGRDDDPVPAALGMALAQRGVATLSLSAPAPGEGHDEAVQTQLRVAVGSVSGRERLLLGGFSRGARVAVSLADELGACGLVAVSYPFHARRDPAPGERLVALQQLAAPALICQGSRDALGNREQVRGYALPPGVEIVWLEDGNHGLVPRVRTGRSQTDLLAVVAESAVRFVDELGG